MMDVFSKIITLRLLLTDYVDGNSVFIFAVNKFYPLSRKIDIFTSFNKARQLDNDTGCMIISLN